MRQALKLHPDSTCGAVSGIGVEIERARRGLALRYVVSGRIEGLLLPPKTAPAHADGLWKRTCFEAFIRSPAGAYCEFNLSPSTEWAAYRFSGYREGMVAADIAGPRIETTVTADRFELWASIDLAGAPDLGAARLALSAVIEEGHGRKSYWALAHPPGKPDFHHPDCFTLELPHA